MESKIVKRGRPVGSTNKVSMTLKSRINLFIDRNFNDLQSEYDKLDPKDKLSFIKDLMPYVVPKLSAVAADVEFKNKLESMSEDQLNQLITHIIEQEDEEPAD